jgi:type IV fimbrial biogenesis protein FimT
MNTSNTFNRPASSCTARLLRRRPAQGFTLVELLVTLAVSAMLLAVAVPSTAAIVKSVRLSSASNVFLSGLYLARNEAIKRNGRVVLCKSPDGIACVSGGGWEQGWIVFHDANNDGVRDGGEIIIRSEASLSSSLRLRGNLNVARYVSFAPSGATKLLSGGFQAGTLTVCHESAESGEGREIVLNAVGRPRVQKSTVGTCG